MNIQPTRPRAVAGLAFALCALPLLAARDTQAEPKAPTSGYAVPFVCGFDPDGAFQRILPGQYATSVLIHNPGPNAVTLRKRVALTFPDENGMSAQVPGLVSGFVTDTLQAGQALQVDCGEIPSELLPGIPFPPYLMGVLSIESRGSLDVRAVYTAGMVDDQGVMEVQSIEVESVPERRL